MPFYCYICDICGETFDDYQKTHTGSREIKCKCGADMHRDYFKERPGVIPDWEAGYNIGIDYHYKNKSDLMREIKRRGLYPSVHGGGIHSTRAKAGYYGDEEYKEMYNPTPSDPPVEVE